MDNWLGSLGAQRFAPLGLGDENVVESLNGSLEADFDHWTEGLLHLLKDEEVGETKKKSGGCGSGKDCCSKKKKKVSNKKGLKTRKIEEYDVTVDSDSDSGEPVVDLEDLGSSLVKREDVNGEEESGAEEETSGDGEVREMLTPLLRESLTKQGYRLIGSHSGVKLCRWTKVFLKIRYLRN
jgi:tRNA wybutosine-synthesizing protein 1